MSATLEAVLPAWVSDGHVAAWVGVGGPGYGPKGADEWIQVGLSAFNADTTNHMYYEYTIAGSDPSDRTWSTTCGYLAYGRSKLTRTPETSGRLSGRSLS